MPYSSPHAGRHESGQNFLRHRPTIRLIASLVAATHGSIMEIGPGDGALTVPLSRLGRPVVAVEIDARRAARLAERIPGVEIQCADATRVRFDHPVVVGNLPFHLTTALLRSLLHQRHWQHVIVLTQWEVARKRAGVGGATMMTAQHSPWYTFTLHGRVPAHGFAPVPSVDGGVISIERRARPLVPDADRRAYRSFVHGVFTGRGVGMASVVAAQVSTPTRRARRLLHRAGIAPTALARDVTAQQWADLWHAVSAQG